MKYIKDYNNRYMVSSDGKVFSNGKELKQEVCKRNSTNYRRVSLSKDGKVKRFQVHRLVAEYYIENPMNKPYVNHIDNNGENNDVSNLEWCTHSENMLHASKQGRLNHTTSNTAHRETMAKARNKLYDDKAKASIGKQFCRWTVIEILERTGYGRKAKARLKATCKCSCGNIQDIVFSRLISGEAKMCKQCSLKLSWEKRKFTTQS